MQVHELAEQAGMSGHTVRYYDRLGLLSPERDPANGYRRFGGDALARLRFIQRAKTLGFTLGEIREILQTSECGNSPCPAVREIVSRRCRENAARIRDLVALQRRLEQAERRWARMPDRSPDGHAVCHLIESFANATGDR